jgi:Matrixin
MTRSALRSAAIAVTPVVVLCALSVLVGLGQQPQPLRALDAKQPITYFIAEGKSQSGYRSSDRQLAQWAFESWERSAAGRFHFEAAPEASALVRLYWAEPDGSEYGEMQPLVVGGRRAAAVFIRPDVQALGPEIAPRAEKDELLRDSIVYLTCLHELGHALGLPHTQDFRDIMYFFGYGGDIAAYFNRYRKQLLSRGDIVSVSGLSDSDVSHIREAYPLNAK